MLEVEVERECQYLFHVTQSKKKLCQSKLGERVINVTGSSGESPRLISTRTSSTESRG